MKKRRSHKRVHPDTIIASFKEVFKTRVVKNWHTDGRKP